MKNKFLIFISVLISVFVFTIGFGVITKVSAKNQQANATSTQQAADYYAQRELQYQQLINQANLQLEQANQQIAILSSEVSGTPAADVTPQWPITADQAVTLAQQAGGSTPTGTPEVVDLNGKAAYEVVFPEGKVYIDATTGEVLNNGIQTQPVQITPQQALQIAMNYLPNSTPVNMYGTYYNNSPVYVIAFSDEQSVYVDLKGNVVAVQVPQSQNQSQSNNSGESQNHEQETD